MSSYLVSDSTINKILAGLQEAAGSGGNVPSLGYELDEAIRNPAALGQKMYDLNVAALYERYDAVEGGGQYAYSRTIPPTRMQFYKSLSCWLYQCSEGDLPRTSELYRAMQDYKHRLGEWIITETPEYFQAKWG